MTNEELMTLNYIKDNIDSMEPSIPIVIPSYKNRPGNIVQNLECLSNNDIYVFVYEDDYLASAYNQYDNKPNVHFVKIQAEWRSIQRKRHFIQKYFLERPEIHDYIMIDDDVTDSKMWTIDKVKHNHLPLINFFGAFEYAHKSLGDKRTYSCTAASDLEFGHYDFKEFMKIHGQLHQVFAISNDFVKSSGIMFRDAENISEDVLLTADLMKAGYDTNTFSWMQYMLTHNMDLKYSLASTMDKQHLYVINTLSILRENARPFFMDSNNTFGTKATMKPNKDWYLMQPIVDDKNKTHKEKFDELLVLLKKLKNKESDDERPSELEGFFE